MKIDINDPRITAFALGELQGRDAQEIARAVQTDTRIRAAVDEVRDTSFMLFDSLSGGGANLLTTDQRKSVRSAGCGAVIEDLASARVALWKKPMVAGIGVAAAVAISLFFIQDRKSGAGTTGMAANDSTDINAGWDWSQVETEDLTASAIVPVSGTGLTESEAAHALAAAISDDTQSFRGEVAKRISQSELNDAHQLPGLIANDWLDVSSDRAYQVPLSSGSASWPWIERYLTEKNVLPPVQTIRIEEMINHFQYSTPSQLTGTELVADMEICHSPWRPDHLLLAVHVAARPGVDYARASASLEVNQERIQKLRLLGYANLAHGNPSKGEPMAGRSLQQISKTHGNYVIYELEPVMAVQGDSVIATLVLGDGTRMSLNQSVAWEGIASPDLRFASTVAATGMLISGQDSSHMVTAEKLLSMLEVIEKGIPASLNKRRKALTIMKKCASIFAANTGK